MTFQGKSKGVKRMGSDNYKGSRMGVMTDLRGFLTPQQVNNIMNACTTMRDRLLIRVLWKSGRRISEALMLKVCDIDFENNNILWNILKKKREFRVWKPMDVRTMQMLRDFIVKSNMPDYFYVFHNGLANKSISRQRAFEIVRRACEAAGIEKVGEKRPHPHHFRHSFAVDKAKKLKSPADIRKLQLFLEHADLGMTEQYLQFGNQDLRDLIEE